MAAKKKKAVKAKKSSTKEKIAPKKTVAKKKSPTPKPKTQKTKPSVRFLGSFDQGDYTTFTVIHKKADKFDTDVIGDKVYGEGEWGSVFPMTSFSDILTDDRLEETGGEFPHSLRNEIGLDDFYKAISEDFDFIFLFDSDSKTFLQTKNEKEIKTKLNDKNLIFSIQQFEIGGMEDEDEEFDE